MEMKLSIGNWVDDTMSIYSEEDDLVVYKYPNNGYDHDQQTARKYLNIDQVYTVDFTDVHSSSTDVYLKDFPNVSFNSVQFAPYYNGG